ncbi:MAG: endo-1,4-beta-xylanase [Planctomycetes bacterium]|nr:endo-1,4-beta-xylanase [Planctomycetota bacterium]
MSGMLMVMAAMALGGPLSEKEILDGADARIQQHRTAEVVLRILDGGEPLPAGTQVRIEQTNHDFLFGCNIFALGRLGTPEANAAYETHFAELLNYATLPFYWWGYETKPGQPGHDRIDEIARWCKAHDVKMKGHPLAWNYVDPKWIPRDVDLAASLQMARIHREVTRFKDAIDIWDVVNEATAYDRQECRKNAPVLTRVIRDAGVGPYLRRAFATARAANPSATLVINDYRDEQDYAAKVLTELVDDDGKPMYDVIGIQSHQHGGAWSIRHIWDVCERFARFGKPLHFTETTFLSGKLGWNLAEATPGFDWESTPDGEKWQSEHAVRFYTVLFSHPAVEAITWWDFADKSSWQRAPAGLLDRNLKPKPAYEALKALVKGEWWTRTMAQAEPDGTARFHGFLGEYKLMVGEGDAVRTGTFALHKTTTGPIEVRLK